MKRKCVLVVEDNVDNRTIFEVILQHAGYQVTCAEDGARGVEVAREAHPDIILMDLSMPVLDGMEATRRLKQDEATSGIPVVLVSAHRVEMSGAGLAAAGFARYLQKPLDPEVLVDTVRELVGA